MRDLLATAARLGLSLVALAYLWLAAPLDLAVSLARLISSPVTLGLPATVLVGARLVVVALGLILGRRLAQHTDGTTRVAVAWALADLVTLAVVLATGVLPSSRAPGDAPIAWAGSAAATLLVVAASALADRLARPPV